MATKIILKKSTTGGSVPANSSLDQGEIAVNLADRKIYTSPDGTAITRLDGAYVSATAPANPFEGDLWYDTATSYLKAYDGTGWTVAGGTVTSVGATVPTGFTVTGSPITSSGTLAFAFDTGYSLPTTASQANWNTAYSWGDHSTAGYLTAEADTLSTVTGRGATTATDIALTAVTTSTNTTSGALVVTGGVGIGENLNVGGNAIITGNLTVNGTTTAVNTNEVNIGDAIILLNSDETGAPSQNAGIEIERGTSANVSFLWDESAGQWSLGGETLGDVIIDGGTY